MSMAFFLFHRNFAGVENFDKLMLHRLALRGCKLLNYFTTKSNYGMRHIICVWLFLKLKNFRHLLRLQLFSHSRHCQQHERLSLPRSFTMYRYRQSSLLCRFNLHMFVCCMSACRDLMKWQSFVDSELIKRQLNFSMKFHRRRFFI